MGITKFVNSALQKLLLSSGRSIKLAFLLGISLLLFGCLNGQPNDNSSANVSASNLSINPSVAVLAWASNRYPNASFTLSNLSFSHPLPGLDKVVAFYALCLHNDQAESASQRCSGGLHLLAVNRNNRQVSEDPSLSFIINVANFSLEANDNYWKAAQAFAEYESFKLFYNFISTNESSYRVSLVFPDNYSQIPFVGGRGKNPALYSQDEIHGIMTASDQPEGESYFVFTSWDSNGGVLAEWTVVFQIYDNGIKRFDGQCIDTGVGSYSREISYADECYRKD